MPWPYSFVLDLFSDFYFIDIFFRFTVFGLPRLVEIVQVQVSTSLLLLYESREVAEAQLSSHEPERDDLAAIPPLQGGQGAARRAQLTTQYAQQATFNHS